MKNLTKYLAVVLASILAACGPTGPRKADVVRGLPSVSFDTAMSAFQRVCAASTPNFSRVEELQATLSSPQAFIFETSRLSGGQPVCSMRARLPEGQNALNELQRRYGRGRLPSGTFVTVFDRYPSGQLVYMPGIRGGAGEGTFQIGLVSGVKL